MSDRLEKAAKDTRSGQGMADPDGASIEARLSRVRVVLINTTHPGNIGQRPGP